MQNEKMLAVLLRVSAIAVVCFSLLLCFGCGEVAINGTSSVDAAANPPKLTQLVVPPTPFTVTNTIHLNSCGVLDKPSSLYVLDNDVNSEGTCFQIKADNIVLDLNGHTVTYDDYPASGLANADFETGTGVIPAEWDLSQAPGVTRQSTADLAMINKWYLAFGTPANGTRIVSPWTKLPAGVKAVSHFLRGDRVWAYATPPIWNMVIESRAVGGAVSTLLNKDFTTDQLFNFTAQTAEFQYRAVLTLKDGHGLALLAWGIGPSIDLFDIRPRDLIGISVSYRKNIKIQNGKIIQGRGRSFLGHGIFLYSSTNLSVSNLAISNSGVESSGIYSNYSNLVSLDKCSITSKSPGVFNRHQMNAAVIAAGGENISITNNFIDSGVGWGCVYVTGKNTEIAFNTLKTQSVVTNHFAVGGGTRIHHNNITADPGQGISTGGDGVEIYSNTITLKKIAPNYEYGYVDMVGIKFNDYGSTTDPYKNIMVYGNNINIIGANDGFYTGYASSPKVITGISNIATGGNVIFDNNKIVARSVDPEVRVVGIEPGGRTTPEVLFRNNTINSDGIIVNFGGYAGQGAIPPNLKFVGNTFIKGPNASSAYHTLGMSRTGEITTDSILFVDTKLSGGASLADIELPSSYGGFSYGVVWLLNVIVSDARGVAIANAMVTVKDKNGLVLFSGNTDNNGTIGIIPVKEYQHVGNGIKKQSQFQYSSPVDIALVVGGSAPVSTTINVTRNQTVQYKVGSGFYAN